MEGGELLARRAGCLGRERGFRVASGSIVIGYFKICESERASLPRCTHCGHRNRREGEEVWLHGCREEGGVA